MISKVLLVTIISSRFVYQWSSLPALEASSDSSVSYSIINIALPDHDYNKFNSVSIQEIARERDISCDNDDVVERGKDEIDDGENFEKINFELRRSIFLDAWDCNVCNVRTENPHDRNTA
uniref:Uncharacterized protein n=1 Tax=Cacopsylla melanoneura TaxID=428564 RepID=A0A8D9FDA3_9HEMI